VQAFDLWGLDLLLRALGDREPRVAREALLVLDEAFDDPSCAGMIRPYPCSHALLLYLTHSLVAVRLSHCEIGIGANTARAG
jgi:hypothetical protein